MRGVTVPDSLHMTLPPQPLKNLPNATLTLRYAHRPQATAQVPQPTGKCPPPLSTVKDRCFFTLYTSPQSGQQCFPSNCTLADCRYKEEAWSWSCRGGSLLGGQLWAVMGSGVDGVEDLKSLTYHGRPKETNPHTRTDGTGRSMTGTKSSMNSPLYPP